MNNTGEIIRQLRKRRGLKAEDLAEKLGVHRATIYRWENGEIEEIPYQILIPIARALQVSPVDLLEMSDEEYERDARDSRLLACFHRLSSDQQDQVLAFVEGLLL